MSQNQEIKLEKKFSLIDLIMILIIIGIAFSFIVPLREDKRNQEMVKEAIQDMQIVIREHIRFKNNPDNGYWAFDLSMLNIDHNLNKNYFNYVLSDTTVTAVSNENFAVEEARFHYYLPNGPWAVDEDEEIRRFINPNWLP